MLAEELLDDAGIEIDMVPVPNEISSDCGMCLACRSEDLDAIKENLREQPFTSAIKIFTKRDSKPGYQHIEIFPIVSG